MVDSRFFSNRGPFTAAALAEVTGATLLRAGDGARAVNDVAPLDRAKATDISFFDNTKYIEQFVNSAAGACFVRSKFAEKAPASMAVLVTEDPYRCYALTAQQFYPTIVASGTIAKSAMIDPSATLGKGITIGAGAVIGANVTIGDRSVIGPNAVIGDAVVIGSDTSIGAVSTITHALIGNKVIIHRGVHIGQDGFGFALGREGHVKVPQLGRVIIEDDVEIGSGTTIDRGTGPDTIIGEGSKIDNLVMIGHNVQVGRRVVIVAQAGVSGSTRIGDGVVIGGQVGVAGHIKIGAGAKLAAKSGVMNDIPAGASFGGTPAMPIVDWHRQTIALTRLSKTKRATNE
jgi:UDP-3-O-[3-hydroxymyristoyl] glucosamine N-acyltransferase